MIQREQLQQFSFFLFYAGLLLLAVSMPLSKFGMSVSQIMIALGWLIGGDFKGKLKKFTSSGPALAIFSVYAIHILGLVHTTDFGYALKDLRIKLPLLILPLLLISSPPLSTARFEKVLMAVVAGVTVSTLISFMVYCGVIQRPVTDIRDISIFISHIRLALLCCVSVFISLWFLYRNYKAGNSVGYFLILVSVIAWLIYFLLLIQSITGIVIIASVAVIFFLYFLISSRNLKMKIALFVAIALLASGSVFKINNVLENFVIREDISSVDTLRLTASGNKYEHFTDRHEYENGYPLWAYICEPEMMREWEKRSELSYSGKDRREHDLRFTLMRFLTSKGLKKDSAGVVSLSDEEVKAIENGIANVYYLNSGRIESRMHQVVWELDNLRSGKNPSGHSLTQRFEYWKTAAQIIRKHPVFGVGTGDVILAFDRQYEEMNSQLSKEWRLRSHNQYLSIGVAFGLTGLAWFVFVLTYLLIISIKRADYLYIAFAITAIISMITEDTLETQAGITFFTLFTCLFLFVNPKNSAVGGNPSRLS